MKITILGANGQIARLVRTRLLAETDAQLTLYLRHANRLKNVNPDRETVIEGDVNDTKKLTSAIKGSDIVYANLGGRFEPMAKSIVEAMDANGIQRLIYITGLGLYYEVPGEFGRWLEASIGHEVMEDTRRAAAILEQSDLNVTIVRAAYMDNNPTVDYELTEKGTPFKGTLISRASIADLVMKIIQQPSLHEHSSLGIDRPGTDGDRPMY